MSVAVKICQVLHVGPAEGRGRLSKKEVKPFSDASFTNTELFFVHVTFAKVISRLSCDQNVSP